MLKKILKEIVVLYVEDEDDVRSFTAKTLSDLVKKVECASDGLSGLKIFKEYFQNPKLRNFDVIITDINMPKMNGLEMLSAIKEIDPSVPMIVTTAYSDMDFLKQAIEIGVTGYVMKPIELNKLLDNIVVATESRILKQQLEARVNKQTAEIRSILDSQDSIIIVTDGKKIAYANQSLFNFFNVTSIKNFIENFGCICKHFVNYQDYFNLDESSKNEDWIKIIKELPKEKQIVKLKNLDKKESIFQIKIKETFFNDSGHEYIITLNDITQIYEQSKKLEYQATHDNLTKLYNRQKFNNELDKEIKREIRYKRNLSIIMIDIDYFKRVNDTYGHDIGDEVLISISSLAKKGIRNTDFLARWGGEEFMILLPETSLKDAQNVAEKIRLSIDNTCLIATKSYHITASFGVTIFNKEDDKLTFIKRVDEALYDAKDKGRNIVCIK